MKIAIHTQIRENYGAHNWDGEGECPQYWKMKGGNTYVIRDVTLTEDCNAGDVVVDHTERHIESFNDMFQEYIIGWETMDDDEPDPVEEWESVINLVISMDRLLATRYTQFSDMETRCYGGFTAKLEQWVQVLGQREEYVLMYEQEDGTMITYAEWVEQQEEVV